MPYISRFGDRAAIENSLRTAPKLKEFVQKYCEATGAKVSHAESTRAYIETPGGIPIGTLYIDPLRDKYGSRLLGDEYNLYSPALVCKEKARGRDSKTRTSKSLAGLIRATKSKDRSVTDAIGYQQTLMGIERAALGRLRVEMFAHISLSTEVAAALVSKLLGDGIYASKYDFAMRKATEEYEKYHATQEAAKNAGANKKRYEVGAWAVVYLSGKRYEAYPYIVYTTGPAEPVIRRVASLAEIPGLMGIAAMLRGYMQGKPEATGASSFTLTDELDKYDADGDYTAYHVSSEYGVTSTSVTIIPTN